MQVRTMDIGEGMKEDSIIIGGDLCPVGRAEPYLCAAHSILDQSLEDEWFGAGLRVANLEAALTDCTQSLAKSGPSLKASPKCYKGLGELKLSVLGLANNHILDYGEEGLSETLAGAKSEGIHTVGAGANALEASEFRIVELAGLRIAFAAYAEHEWSIVSEGCSGANPWSSIGFTRHLRRHVGEYDRLVVLFHGGKEYYEYPPPLLQERCRFMVEQGADAVICQHSHCVGTYEQYQSGVIVYGQGNFVFDKYPGKGDGWQTGMLVRLDPTDESFSASFVPYTQFGEQPMVCAMGDEQKKEFFEALDSRSRKMSEAGFLLAEWKRFCARSGKVYWQTLQGQGRVLRRLNRVIPFDKITYSPAIRRAVLNIIRCESLRETLLTYLENEKGVE